MALNQVIEILSNNVVDGLSHDLSYNRSFFPSYYLFTRAPLRRLIIFIILKTCLYTYYLPNKYLSIYLFLKNRRILAIEYSSSGLFIQTLLLFCYLIEASNILDINWVCVGRNEKLNRRFSTTQLILINLLKARIFLEKWDMTRGKISWT